ncbi:MAG: hypothetical protein ACUVWP_04150 [bacterium]
MGTLRQTSIDACSLIFKHYTLKSTTNVIEVIFKSIDSIFHPSSLLYLFGFSPLLFALPFVIGSLFSVFKENDKNLKKGYYHYSYNDRNYIFSLFHSHRNCILYKKLACRFIQLYYSAYNYMFNTYLC